jgi:hypothetical protein
VSDEAVYRVLCDVPKLRRSRAPWMAHGQYALAKKIEISIICEQHIGAFYTKRAATFQK